MRYRGSPAVRPSPASTACEAKKGTVAMQVGMIGAGHVSQALARYLLQAGHRVMLSSRHGPESLADRVRALGDGATAGTVKEAARAPIVLLAVPWTQIAPALSGLPPWEGRILIDATNHFVQTEPQLLLADLGGRVSSEMVAELAPGARVVKGLNTLTMERFEAGPRQGTGRRVIFL